MPLIPPLKSFFNKRYLPLVLGTLTVLIEASVTAIILKYYLILKYGKDYLTEKEKMNDILTDLGNFEWFSLLFFPILFTIILAIYFITSKENKELRTRLLFYLLSTFLVLGYTWFFLDSAMLYILPSLMIIGAISCFRGGYEEGQKVFIILFLCLLVAWGANRLVTWCFYSF